MLVLARRKGEAVAIWDGDKLIAEVFFIGINSRKNESIKLGFRLPSADVLVWRSEIDPNTNQALLRTQSEPPPA